LVLLAGLGGIYAEALNDIVLWPIPVSIEDIKRKLAASTLGRLFSNPRWTDRDSEESLIRTLDALQRFAMAAGDRLSAVDINPIILGNGRAVAVDALVVPMHK
jgi:hypothetical protein